MNVKKGDENMYRVELDDIEGSVLNACAKATKQEPDDLICKWLTNSIGKLTAILLRKESD